ncbi:MAG: hypothetical protein RLZZ490_2105 [Cyanobacteriota bacterium]
MASLRLTIMDLKKQKQRFLETYLASEKKILSQEAVTQALIPFLETAAKTFKVETVYFFACPSQNKFVTLSLQSRKNPQIQQRFLYFFASEQDAKRHPYFDRKRHRIDKLPILNALLQLLASDEIDQVVIYPKKGRMTESMTLDKPSFVKAFQAFCQDVGITRSVAKTAPFGLA